MDAVLWVLVASPFLCVFYAYLAYPLLLRLRRAPGTMGADVGDDTLPLVTVTLPVYNEERRLAEALDAVLASDYPREKLHVVVVSDASTDDTDRIAGTYAERGVELLRLPVRQGKTAGENASRAMVRGDVVINTDASVRVAPGAIRALASAFHDPSVGVASGYDVSVSDSRAVSVQGEKGYVDFEMELRQRETAWYGIVGASGCLFAIRRDLHAEPLPDALSRDFASALVAREHGYRAVSVPDARVYVPRAGTLAVEYRRKIRTMARGLRTLWYKRHLLDPFRYGFFAFALWSHKVARWLVYPAAFVSLVALAVFAARHVEARILLVAAILGIVLGALAKSRADRPGTGRLVRMAGFAYAANMAGLMAWWEFLRGSQMAVWEPTRRP